MAATERATVLDRLAAAVHSDDLSHRKGLCDIDHIHALGMAGQRQRHGTALLDLHMTLGREDAAEALKAAMQITRDVARRRGWPMTPLKTRRVAGEALTHYLRPTCAPCKGRGVIHADMDKPGQYHPKACPTCAGSGKKPLPLKNRREISEVLYVMEDRLRSAMEHVRRALRMGDDMHD